MTRGDAIGDSLYIADHLIKGMPPNSFYAPNLVFPAFPLKKVQALVLSTQYASARCIDVKLLF